MTSERFDAADFAWLIRLRWGAIAGQVATVAIVGLAFDIALPLAPIALIVAVEIAANLLCFTVADRSSERARALAGSCLAADVLAFTALLYLTGGPYNPFSFVYLVYIAMAVVALGSRWAWSLVALSLIGYGALFTGHRSLEALPEAGHHHGGDTMDLHIVGMWVAFLVCGVFIVYFLSRLVLALRDRERQLRAAREQAGRVEKLASLTTLAAGAAHELNTPLSTIAVVATELERHAARLESDTGLLEDARLIRHEVERCRGILAQLAADAGTTLGERAEELTIDALLDDVLGELSEPGRLRTVIDTSAAGCRLTVPRSSLRQAIVAVVRNALEASPPDQTVRVEVSSSDDQLGVSVIDSGDGMAEDVLARAGEPFFTTKQTGRGMGLGLFLARTVLDGLGGHLGLDSAPGRGTRVKLVLPLAPSLGSDVAESRP